MKLQKILISVLIISCLGTTAALAEGIGYRQKLKNITSFLNSFIDLDSSFNYLADSLNGNPCIQRDSMVLHAQKDELSNRMLSEYRALSQEELDSLKRQYSILNSELTFVRAGKKTRTKRRNKVLDKAKEDVLESIRSTYLAEWEEKYAEQLDREPGDDIPPAEPSSEEGTAENLDEVEEEDLRGEYSTCPNAWTEVAETAKGLQEKLDKIGEERRALSSQLNSTVNAAIATPGNLYAAGREAFNNSVDSVWGSIQESYSNAVETLARNNINQDDYLEDVEAEYRARDNRSELATVLENTSSLSEIPSILSQSDAENQERQRAAVEDISLPYIARYHDSLVLSLYYTNQEINTSLEETNSLFTPEDTGLTDILKEIASRQCGSIF